MALTLLIGPTSCCIAQDDKRALETSITRLEQRLARMDDYLKSLQTGQAQQRQERDQAVQSAQTELKQLRDALAAQEQEVARARHDRERAQAELLAVRKQSQKAEQDFQSAARQEQQKREQAERHLRSALETSRQKADEAERTAAVRLDEVLAKAQGQNSGQDAFARLADERREIQRLREAVAKDLEVARQRQGETRRQTDGQAKELQALRDENEGLRRKLRAIEEAQQRHSTPSPAPGAAAAPGTIVINNEDGQVHFHFHGGATPNITNQAGVSRAAPTDAPRGMIGFPVGPSTAGPKGPTTGGPAGPMGPSSAGPSGPSRAAAPQTVPVRASDVPGEPAPSAPKPRGKDKPKDDAPSERKINDETPEDPRDAAPVANFVQVLYGVF